MSKVISWSSKTSCFTLENFILTWSSFITWLKDPKPAEDQIKAPKANKISKIRSAMQQPTTNKSKWKLCPEQTKYCLPFSDSIGQMVSWLEWYHSPSLNAKMIRTRPKSSPPLNKISKTFLKKNVTFAIKIEFFRFILMLYSIWIFAPKIIIFIIAHFDFFVVFEFSHQNHNLLLDSFEYVVFQKNA